MGPDTILTLASKELVISRLRLGEQSDLFEFEYGELTYLHAELTHVDEELTYLHEKQEIDLEKEVDFEEGFEWDTYSD